MTLPTELLPLTQSKATPHYLQFFYGTQLPAVGVEGAGFEPAQTRRSTGLQPVAIGHSTTPPQIDPLMEQDIEEK